MDKKNTTINREVSISKFNQWRAEDTRNTSNIRKSITKRVGGVYLPRCLSSETRKYIIRNLTETSETLIEQLNHIKQRYWISELCEFQYCGDNGRCYTFNKIELQKIDFTLKQNNINQNSDIEEEPPRIKRMRIK